MSNPTRSQQRFPFRIPVRLHKNYRRLPPITATIRPIEEENEPIISPIPSRKQENEPIISLTRSMERENEPIISLTRSMERENEPIKSSLSIDNVDIECETPRIDEDFWVNLHKHLDKERLKHHDDHGSQRTPNKVVRIFVSSTFTDFFNEREVLIKKVFSALRDEMEPAGIQIIDCDLRWGVPKDSTTEQTILTCLEELDRCFEDNGQPFFIGLISDKYGWVPKLNELPKNITERYHWIDGASITLMEFIHGAFRTNNPNAFFLIRKSENILKNLPEKYADKFRDKDELSQKQIKELKSQLSQFVSPEQIFSYDCFYNGLDSSTGRERVRIDGLHEFEEQAKKFLTQAIYKWYPDNFNTDTSFKSEQKQMTTFLLNKTQLYVDRPDEFSVLFKYITGDHRYFTIIEGTTPAKENHIPIMTLKGQSGNGKTMLLGKFVLDLEKQMEDKFFLFYYFTDGAFHGNATNFMLPDLMKKFEKYLDENDLRSPKTGERPKTSDDNFLSDAVALISIPIVIIVDGLDKGDIRQQRKYSEQFPFSSLYQLTSDHTYIIISTEIDSRLHQTMHYYSRYELEVKPLTIEQRRLYIEMFFHRFNKTLEPEQKALLMNNKGGEHPLYLSYVCENLRQFGDYSLVTNRLKTYPQTIDELLEVLLNEVYTIIDNQPLVDAFFKLLIISNIGILESDIVNMLQYYLNNNNTDENNQISINQMTWSTLRRHLKTFLDTTWIEGHQLIIFRHSSLEQKIRQRCFKEDTNEIRSLNVFLADFHTKHPSIKDFSSRRIPYHYDEAHMHKELITYLRSQASYGVNRIERQTYLRKRRCTKIIPPTDSMLSQQAYLCNICAMQFKLGPYTMAKSSCLICTNMILGGNTGASNVMKREARLCQKHGSMGYPHNFQCIVCKVLRPKVTGTTKTPFDPVPLNICFDCWCAGGGGTRCCGFEID